MILFLYAILVFLVLRFSVTLFNFLSNPKLGLCVRHYTDVITVYLKIKDDSASQTIHALLAQEYQQLDIIVEKSEVYALNEPIIAQYEDHLSVRIIEIDADPLLQANGQYLLFLNTDIRFVHGSLNSMVNRMKVFRLSLLNIIPVNYQPDLWNACLRPLYHFILLSLVPLRLIRLSQSSIFAAGSTECIMLDRHMYTQGIEGLPHTLPSDTDGMEMIRRIKEQGLKTETLLGGRLVYNFTLETGVSIFKNTGLRLYSVLGNNIFAVLLYLLLVVAGPIVLFISLDLYLLILPAGLIFLSRMMQSFLAGQHVWKNLLLHPIQMLLLAGSLIYSSTRKLFNLRSK